MTDQSPVMPPVAQPPKSKLPWVLAGAGVLVIALVVALVIVLLGSSSDDSSTSAPAASPATEAPRTVTVVSSAPNGHLDAQDKVFLSALDDPTFEDIDRDVLIERAHGLCVSMESAGNVATLQLILDAGFDIDQAASLLHASVMAYCPEQLVGVQ